MLRDTVPSPPPHQPTNPTDTVLVPPPQVLNVSMLRDSPCHVPQRKQLSAKATGEPPLMMAAAVACALQDAVHAAWRQHDQQQQQQGKEEKQEEGGGVLGPGSWPVLQLPATTPHILQALPPLRL
jgi:hypothetical protein